MVWQSLQNTKGGEIFVSKNPSIKINDLAKSMTLNPIKDIGIR